MQFSLILPTLNRPNLLKYCLKSLLNQSFNEFEIIIIDQSDNDETKQLVSEIDDSRILYKRVGFRGLSKARNAALKISTGDYFCLIDDDAFYHKDYLKRICKHLNDNKEKSIITGYMWDAVENKPFLNYTVLGKNKVLSVREVLKYCPSPCLSFPVELINDIGLFDERLGVGAIFGAGEETDYLLRAMNSGYRVIYYRDVENRHPHEKVEKSLNSVSSVKIASYMEGIGAMMGKNVELKGVKTQLIMYRYELTVKYIIKMIALRRNAFNEIKRFYKGYKSIRKCNNCQTEQ